MSGDSVYVISGAPDPNAQQPVAPTLADVVTAAQTLQAEALASALAAAADAAAALASASTAAASATTATGALTETQELLQTLSAQMAEISIVYAGILNSQGVLAQATTAANNATAAVASIQAQLNAAQSGPVISVMGMGGTVTGLLLAANNLSDLISASAARAALGLGSAAILIAGGANGAATLDGTGKIPSTQALVASVAGKTGTVSLASTDLSDGTALGRALFTAASAAAALTSLGASAIGALLFQAVTAAAAFNDISPLTTQGDILYGGASGAGTRLAAGTSSQVLKGGTTPSWGPVGLTNQVTGILPVANGGTGQTTLGASLPATPLTNPTANTSGTYKMMGLGASVSITPRTTGRLLITIQGTLYSGASGGNIYAAYGTGTAPINGAAVAGTALTTGLICAASATVPFTVSGITPVLTVGTAYWIDLAQAGANNTGALTGITASVMEF